MNARAIVRGIRRRLELTQAGLAARLGVSPNTVARWERGEVRPSPWHGERLQQIHDSIRPDFSRQMRLHEANKRTPEALLVLREMIRHTARWDRARGIDPRERCRRARSER